jgi:hypothetical protein
MLSALPRIVLGKSLVHQSKEALFMKSKVLSFVLLLVVALFGAACGSATDTSQEDGQVVRQAVTEFSATMWIKPGTTCNPAAPVNTVVTLLPDPNNFNNTTYLTKVSILNKSPDRGFWQNFSGTFPYNDSAVVSATEWAAYCNTLNAVGKNSKVIVYWDGTNCPSGQCVETRSPAISNL